MLHTIEKATAHPDYTVATTWTDGIAASVSLTHFHTRGGVFAPLRDPGYFVREMRVLTGGIGLAWPNEVDFSSDGLRRDVFPEEETGEAIPAVVASLG
jgi:hypothetical protein